MKWTCLNEETVKQVKVASLVIKLLQSQYSKLIWIIQIYFKTVMYIWFLLSIEMDFELLLLYAGRLLEYEIKFLELTKFFKLLECVTNMRIIGYNMYYFLMTHVYENIFIFVITLIVDISERLLRRGWSRTMLKDACADILYYKFAKTSV